MKIGFKLVIGNAIPLILIIALVLVCAWSVRSLVQASEKVDQASQISADAKAIEAAAINMETGMRGYMLSGKDEFLEPYNDGSRDFDDRVVALEEKINKFKDDEKQAKEQIDRLKAIKQNIDTWRDDVVSPMTKLRADIGDAPNMDDMSDLVGQAKGKENFDLFRKQVASFTEVEEKLLVKRQDDSDKAIAVLEENEKWVTHTYSVIGRAQLLLAHAVDMETGMRGFMLAGVEEFLEPYNSGSKGFYDEVKSLQKTVDDNPAQVQLLQEMEANIREWQKNVTEPAIALRRSVGEDKTMDDVAARVAEGRGKAYFDKFRGQVATFIEREEVLLVEREKKSAEAMAIVKETNKWVNHTYKVIASANKLLTDAINMETGMRGYLLAGKDEFLAPYRDGQSRFFSDLDQLQETVSDNPPQVRLLEDIKLNMQKWVKEVTTPTIALRTEIGDAPTMNDVADRVGEKRGKKYFDAFRGKVAQFVETENTEMIKLQAQAEQTTLRAYIILIIGTISIVILAVLSAVIMSMSILRPLKKINNRIEDIASGDGDLTLRVDHQCNDELGTLSKNVDLFLDQIHGIISEFRAASVEVASAANEIASSSEQIAKGVEEQTSQTRQVSAAVEQMAATTNEVASKAANAVVSANQAGEDAVQGGDVVDQAVNSMHEIASMVSNSANNVTQLGERSEQIGEIIEVINDIADQTNLLALNAAIEAARAGEAGRGFAVVADEVRQLAERTGKATQKVTDSIKTIQDGTRAAVVDMKNGATTVTTGVNLATQAGERLGTIVGGSKEVATMIETIAAASEEQSSVAVTIAQNIENITAISNETSHGIQQSATAATQLSEKSESLRSLVEKFKL